MNPAGIVLTIAGMWIISQIFAGNALQRLNIVKAPEISTPAIPSVPSIPGFPWLPGSPNNPVVPKF